MLFSNMTLNPQPLHIDAHFCATETEWGKPLVNSLFTLGLMIGISVGDTTVATTIGNLGMTDVKFPAPLFEGETVHVTTEILSKRESKSRPDAGIVDFHMSARRMLTVEQSRQLIALMRNAPGPILIHCSAGADRTGLASVMYMQQIAGVDEETAEWQLSPLYGHLNLPFLSVYAMDDTWESFEKAIGLDS